MAIESDFAQLRSPSQACGSMRASPMGRQMKINRSESFDLNTAIGGMRLGNVAGGNDTIGPFSPEKTSV